MLRRIFSRPLFNRERHASPPSDSLATRQVYLNLFDVQRSHALIEVAVDGTEAHYQSIILALDPEAGTMTIDELFPNGFVGLPGQPLTIIVRLDGKRRLSFTTSILARESEEGIESYRLALPDFVDYNQRRGAYRLQLRGNWGTVSQFRAADRRCSATVRDLSSTGIRLELQEPAAVAEGDVLTDLRFEFAGRSFQCHADVRNVAQNDGDNVVLGAAFRDMPRVEQRSLERMIMQMQRQQAAHFAV
jgi:c-di-GMP-binding flagellar brake protein YcgR